MDTRQEQVFQGALSEGPLLLLLCVYLSIAIKIGMAFFCISLLLSAEIYGLPALLYYIYS